MNHSNFREDLYRLAGKLLLIVLCMGIIQTSTAQEQAQTDSLQKIPPADSIAVHKNGASKRKVSVTFGSRNKDLARSPKVTFSGKKEDGGHAIYGITFSRIDLGFTKLMDNGSFTLSDKNSFLKNRTWKTYNFGFDLLQVGYRFNDNFRIFLSGGFDWTFIRLKEDIAFLRNTSPLQYEHTGIDYDKNRLTAAYIRLPLTFEHRFDDGNMRVAYGPIGGFLMHGSQLMKSEEQGKLSVRDDFNFTQFKYGAFVRWGYEGFGVFAKYYFNNMFENSPEQDGLKDFTFGIMLGF